MAARPTSNPPPTGPLSPDPSHSKIQISQLGKYRIVRKLGVGGSATVYLAIDTTIDKQVALKVLHEHLREDPVTIRRFTNDARALAKLNHPNIVQIYAAELDQYYFAMEYVDGAQADLARLIADNGSLPEGRAIAIALQVADALAHIHRQGLIHRDIKPGNILIAPGDRVKMTDFSIVREVEETMLTMKGSLIGTVEYMAPEQIREEASDFRVDVYALGAVLYEMWIGRPPFVREAGVADLWPLMERILNDRPKPPAQINPAVSAKISEAVSRALEKDPAHRFLDMAAFAADLRSSMDATATVMVIPVALAKPVEHEGTVRLSWSASDSAEFDRYEVHSAADRDFIPSDQTLLKIIQDRTATELAFPVPAGGGILYYRIRTTLQGAIASVSNRAMIEFGYRPLFWRRREFQWMAGLAAIVVLGVSLYAFLTRGRSDPRLVNIIQGPDRARAVGRFSDARFFPSTGRFRLTLTRPTFEILEAGSITESLKGRNVARLIVDVPEPIASALMADGVDMSLLSPQSLTAEGKLSEDANLGVVLTPAEKSGLKFEKTRADILDVAAAEWKQHAGKLVRINTRVTDVRISEASNTAHLTLDPDIGVVVFSAVKNGLEQKGIKPEDLKGKSVAIRGQVRNDRQYGLQIILARPEHLILK